MNFNLLCSLFFTFFPKFEPQNDKKVRSLCLFVYLQHKKNMILSKKIVLHSLNSLKYLTFGKIFNGSKLLFSYLFSGKLHTIKISASPAFVSVEPYNFCQLQCPECPVSLRNPTTKAFINEQIYIKTISELKDKLFHVIFYFQGEPLLNKKLPEMIQYAHQNKIFTSTSTNAQALNSEMAKNLVLSGLDKLIISIDGYTQEIYEQYRVGGSLEKAITGVKNIIEWKKELNSITPFIEIQFVVFKTNEHQMEQMKTLSKTLKADRLVYKTAQLHDYENGHKLLTTLDKYARYKKTADGKYVIKNKLKNRCWRLWSGAVINANADVVPCCFDKNSAHAFGNLENSSFLSVWHNKKASGFRVSILQNRKQYDMCRNCTSK